MTAEDIRSVLEELAAGNTTVDAALLALRKEPFSDLGYAKVDHHREMRQGAAEVIYGASKTYEQIKGIRQSLLDNGQICILITRVSAESAALLAADFAEKPVTLSRLSTSSTNIRFRLPVPFPCISPRGSISIFFCK